MKSLLAAAGLVCVGGLLGAWQDPETKKKIVKERELVGPWVYDDLSAGFAQAKKTGKPMLIVFR